MAAPTGVADDRLLVVRVTPRGTFPTSGTGSRRQGRHREVSGTAAKDGTGMTAAPVIAFAVRQTLIVPAVHDVQQGLGDSRVWSSWLVTVYLPVATMAMGRLADPHGRRRLLLIGLGRSERDRPGPLPSPQIRSLVPAYHPVHARRRLPHRHRLPRPRT